jgi:hypothetical protein
MQVKNPSADDLKNFELRPYKLKELAGLYQMERNTFRRRLKPLEPALGERTGHYYSVSQVKIIVRGLGNPMASLFDDV